MTKIFQTLKHLSTIMQNTRSKTPSVIGVTETWLSSKEQAKMKHVQLPDYVFQASNREQGIGGGVGLYIKNIEHEVRDNIKLTQGESKWIELWVKEYKIVIGVIYASEKYRNRKDFINEMDQIFEHLTSERKKILIMGDMNIDLLTIQPSDLYSQTLLSNGIKSMVTFPTRVTNQTETLIDHILTNMTDMNCKPTGGAIINDISDHYSTFAVFPNQEKMSNHKSNIRILSFKKYRLEEAREKLQNENWTDITALNNVNEALNILISKLIKYQSEVIQTVEIKVESKFQQPWMTSGIRRSQKERYKLYKKSKAKSNNEELSNKYKRYRNNLCRIMRKAEKDYYTKLIEQAEGNQGKTWHIINDIMGRKKKRTELPDKLILNDQSEIQGDENVSNALNKFFTEIGNQLALNIPPSRRKPEDYLSEIHHPNSFYINPTTEQEVYSIMSKINVNKSSGPEGLHPRYIRDMSNLIALPMAHIINLSIEAGIVPDQLKVARVVPLYKAGNKFKAENYRPISLLSVLTKTLESLIYKRLMSYIYQEQILTTSQYGFRRGKNTKGALLKFISSIQDGMDKGEKTGAVYLDLQKAFLILWTTKYYYVN